MAPRGSLHATILLALLAQDLAAQPAPGSLLSSGKISATSGGLPAGLDGGDGFGWSSAAIGDLDGDGTADLAVGAPFDDDGGTDRGAVWILFLNPDGTVGSTAKISALTPGFAGQLGDFDWFGWSVASLGDLGGNGTQELAVGAIQSDSGGSDTGAIWIVSLNGDGTLAGQLRIGNGSGGFLGGIPDFAWFGGALAPLGDFDNDGTADLAVGAFGDSDNGTFRGAVWFLLLNPNGSVKDQAKANDSLPVLSGLLDDGDEFGWSASALGDLDGDGAPELAVGAILDDDGGQDHGAVYVLFLNDTGGNIIKSVTKISSLAGNFGGVLEHRDHFGRSVCAAGDLDGDGLPNLAVGASKDDDGALDAGALWLLNLALDGSVLSHQLISATSGGFPGPLEADDGFGQSVASLGDLDGDGGLELAVGANRDDDGFTNAGAVWMLHLAGSGGPWLDLGSALAGVSGPPSLVGTGPLTAGSAGSLNLTSAAPSKVALLFISLVNGAAPFKGGILKPVPSLLEIPLFTNGAGAIPLPFTWPAGVPAGTKLYFQEAISDPAAIEGVSLSNALQATAQ